MVDDRAPMLQMDGIRIATLAVLSLVTITVVALAVFLVTYVQDQRLVNECYQRQLVALTSWADNAVQAGRGDRNAQLAMLNTILDPNASPDARRVAVEDWRRAVIESDRTRQAAPVPEQLCAR